MALTPEVEVEQAAVTEETVDEQPVLRTYSLDFANGTIGDMIDGEDAIRQFAQKALMTERSKYVIYSDDYGTEMHSLIGEDLTKELFDSEVKRMVTETFEYSPLIEEVAGITAERIADKLYVSTTLVSASGATAQVEEEVL